MKSMQIDVITIFPELVEPFFGSSMPRIAREKGAVEPRIHDLRDWTTDKHRTVDDTPFGGGPGMVMKPEPFFAALKDLRKDDQPAGKVVMMSPRGHRMDQAMVQDLAKEERLIILCGRYEGVDQRVVDGLVDLEVSVGDYVLSGGEPAAWVLMDAVIRQLPGVLGDAESLSEESFSDTEEGRLLEYPQYTRPAEFQGMDVPEVLISGNHEKIRRWRHAKRLELTRARRPDLLQSKNLSVEETCHEQS